jgi:hypothetical protein
MIKKITAWSWSRYADYCQCPRKTKLKHVDKMKEPGSAAMNRGAALHDLLAAFLKGTLKELPKLFTYTFDGEEFKEPFPDMKWALTELKKLRTKVIRKTAGMTVEDDWAFTKAWERCRWDDWAKCWVRIKLDLAHPEQRGKLLVITDWKSGKFRLEDTAEYKKQLSLYALAGLLLHPKVEVVQPRLGYLDIGKFYQGDEYVQEDVPALKKLWGERVANLFQDTLFAPTPSSKCRWCFFGQAKKGPAADQGPGLCEF